MQILPNLQQKKIAATASPNTSRPQRRRAEWSQAWTILSQANRNRELQRYRDREYHAGVISIRNQLVYVFLSSTRQLDNPIVIPVSIAYQDELYDHINLVTTINKADLYPAYFDICVDTVFGAPKNLISRLLEWDKTREYQVYRIFGDHGETWHRGFANTCPKPFKTWLSSIICLEKYGSAISNNPPPDLEILIQDQKEQVKKRNSRMEGNLYE
ncbi:hypothetical protein H4I96_10373 [Botrytis cinerea]